MDLENENNCTDSDESMQTNESDNECESIDSNETDKTDDSTNSSESDDDGDVHSLPLKKPKQTIGDTKHSFKEQVMVIVNKLKTVSTNSVINFELQHSPLMVIAKGTVSRFFVQINMKF